MPLTSRSSGLEAKGTAVGAGSMLCVVLDTSPLSVDGSAAAAAAADAAVAVAATGVDTVAGVVATAAAVGAAVTAAGAGVRSEADTLARMVLASRVRVCLFVVSSDTTSCTGAARFRVAMVRE